VLATGADLAVSGDAVLGDVLALTGGVAGAVYFALGERARTVVSTTVYSTLSYSVCAAALLVVCLVTGTELVDFPAAAWLAIIGTTVFPQLLGHTMVNYALQRVSATTVNVLLLLEVPGATLLGWLIIDQLPDVRSVPGLAILTVGVAVVLIGAARAASVRDAAQQPTL
jgi:drug/metabolite transporter (DMT)-like permease